MRNKNSYFLILCFLFTSLLINAQNKPGKKPAKIWYKPLKVETKEVKLEAKNALAEKEITKFKWIISNNTKDFLIVQPQECNFKTASAELLPNDKKRIIVRPFDNVSKVIDGTNTKSNSIYELSVSFNAGGIYKSENAITEELPDYNIPPAVNSIEQGDFRVEMVSYNAQSNNQLKIKLKVTYLGEGIGIVEPAKISARVAGGVTVTNAEADKMFILERGESETFTTYFNNFQQVLMVWNDTFKSAALKKLDTIEMHFEYDPEGGNNAYRH